MDYSTIKFETDDAIGIITVNRPDAMNVLNSAFFKDMNSLLDSLPEKVKILIITGNGKAFVAGADIAEMVNLTKAEGFEFSQTGQKLFERLENLEIPVIAAVNGFALGGGCELALACDFRYASSKAKFSQPEVNLGLITGYAGSQRLPKLVGEGNAMELLLTGEMIDAERALNMGLVQKVFEPELLVEETIKTANLILTKGPQAVKKMKSVLVKSRNLSFQKGSELEAEEFSRLFEGEAKEGMKSFLEKRKANW